MRRTTCLWVGKVRVNIHTKVFPLELENLTKNITKLIVTREAEHVIVYEYPIHFCPKRIAASWGNSILSPETLSKRIAVLTDLCHECCRSIIY
jgi:hypothetical protein